jgi:molybdopterin-guanine dinucleotide biosynthesis protein A
MEKWPATAVLLAGGESIRMGEDKALLPLDGIPLIVRAARFLQEHFEEVLLSTGKTSRYEFLGLPILLDEIPNQGPMSGILQGLRHARHDLVFFMACDVPFYDAAALQRLYRAAGLCDCSALLLADGKMEPAFAFYHKRILPVVERLFTEGTRALHCICEHVCCGYVDGAHLTLPNLNTRPEYEQFIADSTKAVQGSENKADKDTRP